MADTIPVYAVELLRDGKVRGNPQASLDLYDWMTRVCKRQWVNHFKRGYDFASSVLIRDELIYAFMDLLVARKPTYMLSPYGYKVCDITTVTHYSVPFCYWLFTRKVPVIITLLTAKQCGVDYIGTYTMDIAIKLVASQELHKCMIWLRRRLANEGDNLYSLDCYHLRADLLAYIKADSAYPGVRERRHNVADDAILILTNRYPGTLYDRN